MNWTLGAVALGTIGLFSLFSCNEEEEIKQLDKDHIAENPRPDDEVTTEKVATWSHEELLTAKETCVIASQLEKLQALSNPELQMGIEAIQTEIGGEMHYDLYIDLYCACKAKRISNYFSFQDWQLNTARAEIAFINSEENTSCVTESIAECNNLRF